MEFNLWNNATQIKKLKLLQIEPLHVPVIFNRSTTNERNALNPYKLALNFQHQLPKFENIQNMIVKNSLKID